MTDIGKIDRPGFARSEFTRTEQASYQAYLEKIAQDHCPFLRDSLFRGGTVTDVFRISEDVYSLDFLRLFLAVLRCVEGFVAQRRKFTARAKLLYCRNIAMIGPIGEAAEWNRLMSSLHWPLKDDYTACGVMFGKFWPGEALTSRSGVPIPDPPFGLLSIRSALRHRDQAFFERSPWLIGELQGADMNCADNTLSRVARAKTDQALEILKDRVKLY